MTLCDEGHEEVCYEGKFCPVCELQDRLTDEIKDLQNQIKELEEGY